MQSLGKIWILLREFYQGESLLTRIEEFKPFVKLRSNLAMQPLNIEMNCGQKQTFI